MSPTQRDLARHALGLTRGASQSYRNHFVTGEGCTDHPEWMAMVAAGYATVTPKRVLFGGDDLFRLTPEGAKAAIDPGETLDSDSFSRRRA